MGKVEGLFVCAAAGLPMQRRTSVDVIEQLGIDGDRYLLGTGAYSRKPYRVRHVAFILPVSTR
jgi:hypothetical protein